MVIHLLRLRRQRLLRRPYQGQLHRRAWRSQYHQDRRPHRNHQSWLHSHLLEPRLAHPHRPTIGHNISTCVATTKWGKKRGTNLVKISLDEVHLLCFLQQTRPVLQFELLLSENHLHATWAVVYFTVVDVDFSIEIQRHAVLVAFQVCAGKRNIVLCEFDVCRFGGHIGNVDEDVEVVAGFVRVGGALSPSDYI